MRNGWATREKKAFVGEDFSLVLPGLLDLADLVDLFDTCDLNDSLDAVLGGLRSMA